MTPKEHARARAESAPTPDQIVAVFNAICGEPPHCHASGVFRGWTFGVHDSPFTQGAVLVTIMKKDEMGKSEEVADLDAARNWLRRNAV